ncbi:uncharacterized protein LOC132631475 [Lycium barbarum]|uniref:uncharacterized protein LOC132631475 n=1 Tax=Lycium barbarum TaxID=112863 RepID=UPI00293F137E|nr:uncharacterized protein LOC132631475 [Lycium barbarum]
MCYPIEEGGLGFKRLKDISEALAMKRWWRFRTEKTLWAEFLKIKYSRLAHPIDRKWRAGLGALAHIILHNDIGRNHRVNEIIEDGLWNIEQLHLPEYLAELILDIPIGNMNLLDNPIWMPSPNGKFSTSSAWGIIRQSQDTDQILHKIWHKYIPFKMCFLVWKMLKNKLPFDNIISRIGIDVGTKCCCCLQAKDETIHHTFLDGELARTIWNFFGIPSGIPREHNTLRTLLMKWWSVKAENGLHKDLLKVIPVVIFWEIWKSRCSNRYGKSKISKARVIYQIKLNTDGSHNCEDDIGAGGIVRDSNGNLIMAFAKSLGKGSSNLAEAKVALYGMKWCISNGFRNIILESDSLIIINMLEGKINIAWELQDSIDTIKQLLSQTNYIAQHCYREANQVADALAKWSMNGQEEIVFEIKNLPKEAVGTYILDKDNVASIRHKQRKNIYV